MAFMVLDRFSDGNSIGWIFRAQQYFTYLRILEKEWLPLAPFYLNGAAYDWFQWLYRNKQFFDWKHFTEKLALRFRNDSNMINHYVNSLDMMRKLDETLSTILCKLDNVQRALSAYSQPLVADPVPLDMDSSYDDKEVPALSFDESSHTFEDLVASDSDAVDECIQPSLQADVVQRHMQVLLSDLLFDLNDGTLEEVNSGTLEEVSGVSAYKVFAEIPNRDIDMGVADSVKNDLVKLENHVFDERFHTISIVRCGSNNLIKFDEMSFAFPCMLSAYSSSNDIFAYLGELDPTKLPLSLYRFSLAQLKLEFPFDPGSSMLTTFFGSTRCFSFLVMDDLREIIKIFMCHFDSTTSDQGTFNRFPYDPGANLFIVAFGGRLQVHPLHLATSVFTLLFLREIIQLFESVSYIRPNVEPATSFIENEPTISIWDPGINSEFTTVIGSTTKMQISKFTVSAMFLCKILEYQLRAARRQNKWTSSSSSSYFMCSIFKKALYSLSPHNDSAWSMILQLYSSLSSDCANIIKLKKARKWKGLEHNPLVNLMSLFTITYNSEHLGTRYSRRNEYIGMVKRPYQSPYLSHGYQIDSKKSRGVSMFFKTMLCKLDASTGYNDCNQLDKCVTWVGSKLVLTNTNAFARQCYYAGLCKVCTKKVTFLLADRAHISGLVSFCVMCSHFTYATGVTSSTQFMGAKVYPTVVFGKSLFALEGFGNEKTVFYVVSRLVVVVRSIQDHILYFANIVQFVLATVGGQHVSNIVLDLNLEDKVLIEDGSIVVNQDKVYGLEVVGKTDFVEIIGPNNMLESFIWDPGPINNWLKRHEGFGRKEHAYCEETTVHPILFLESDLLISILIFILCYLLF